ncbi:mRNA export factor Gle1 [Musca vetustissima]|uniref:mRNA export factor Gle1 n=1 Tax=Musca vetustissima TaxID=27455 RepID=UPI002AB6487F|nr:mRNA export factor Gle1 [Musca vetustissima]
MLAQKVEEALNDINKLHITVLEHAAEISPLIKGRSLGPDVDNKENSTQKRSDKKENVWISTNKSKTPTKQSPASKTTQNHTTDTLDFNSLQNLDVNTVNSSILLREAEEARKRTIRQQVLDMHEKHLTIMQECLKPIEEQCKEEKRKWLEKKRQSDSQIIARAEQQSELDLKEHQRQLETLRLQTQRQLQVISFQGIAQYQSKFRSKYEAIVNLLMSIDKSVLMSCNEYNNKLKELIQMFEQLINKIKSGTCGGEELKTADNLCKSLAALEVGILEALKQEKEKQENIAKEEQQKAQRANEQQLQQQQQAAAQQHQQQQQQPPLPQEPPAQQAPAPPAQQQNVTPQTEATPQQQQQQNVPETKSSDETDKTTNISSQHVSQERLEFYTKINTFYLEKVERVKALQSDESMKKYRFDCQKSINIPVNAISAVSPQHIQDKFDKLYSFVSAQPPLGRDYCILLMAKKFVGQGETTISSNPQAAFPVASVIVSLWKCMPEFGQLFLAYCFKECPFLVPYFIPQKKDQSPEEYSKVLGFRTVDGQPEKQEMYLKRQAGIARLYAAVMVTNGRKQDSSPHPYGIENAWRWLTNMMDIAPLPFLSATLIMEILQIVGSDMWSNYGRQFVKLLMYIQQHYFAKLSDGDTGGPKARLELLLNNFLRDGQIQKPAGMLPLGFW